MAITFHKSQGQTLRRVVIDPSTFAPGQLYVGLSRATSPSSVSNTHLDVYKRQSLMRLEEGLPWPHMATTAFL